MTKKKTPKRKAAKQRGPGRPFKPGQSGNPAGRPKGFDFRFAILEYCDKHKVNLHEAMGRVFLAMVNEAENGDVQAAKLVFDRLCGPIEPAPVLAIIDKRPPPEMGPDEDDDWPAYFDKLAEVTRSIKPTFENGKDRGA